MPYYLATGGSHPPEAGAGEDRRRSLKPDNDGRCRADMDVPSCYPLMALSLQVIVQTAFPARTIAAEP